jgi:hypothetical protein
VYFCAYDLEEASNAQSQVGAQGDDGFHAPAAWDIHRSADTIARTMARKDVSPRGLASGIRMIQYFINRGGKNLSARRRAKLERAKRILQRRAADGGRPPRRHRDCAHVPC